MKQTIRVENHQPVALRPIREVMKTCEVMWVGTIVYQSDDSGNPVGWVKAGGNDEWLELEDSVSSSGHYNRATYLYFLESYGVDLDKTMARALQPGEKLIVEIG